MATELCSLKAVEAQMDRRVAEVGHSERKAMAQISKLEKEL
jgi:hypothetical protein